MMSRKLLISTGLTGVLLLGACDTLMRAGTGCGTIRHNVVGMSADTVKLASGLSYIELQVGTGAVAQSCRSTTVRYTASVLGGAEIENSTVDVIPGMGLLIPGFEQGVVGINVGGIRRVFIPPDLAYGSVPRVDGNGEVVIPANSTLIFDLELLAAN